MRRILLVVSVLFFGEFGRALSFPDQEVLEQKAHWEKSSAFEGNPRRQGLPPRSLQESSLKGQMTEAEWEALRLRAIKIQKPITISGSLAETDIGITRRYLLEKHPEMAPKFGIPEWRTNKLRSELVDSGVGDIDIWEGSGLTKEQLEAIHKEIFPMFKIPDQGYSLKRYPSLEWFDAFHEGPGAIIFEPNGQVVRIEGAWQRTNLGDR